LFDFVQNHELKIQEEHLRRTGSKQAADKIAKVQCCFLQKNEQNMSAHPVREQTYDWTALAEKVMILMFQKKQQFKLYNA